MSLDKQGGYISTMLVSLISVSVVLAVALGFGTWAYISRQDYKNNSDQKAVEAADERQKATEAADAAQYAEEAKNPLTTHKAPAQYGGVTIQYPKTWSGYVIEKPSGTTQIDDYFHPSVVPDAMDKDNAFAVRIEVLDQTYDKVLKTYDNEIDAKKLVAAPYTFAKVPDVVGTRLDGEVELNKQGSLVVVPMRNLTLKVWTESPTFLADFNAIILPNLSFSP